MAGRSQLVPLAVRELANKVVVPKLDLSRMWDRADGGDATVLCSMQAASQRERARGAGG